MSDSSFDYSLPGSGKLVEDKVARQWILDQIDSPTDLKKLKPVELKQLAKEIRKEILAVIATNGGHLAPNLGVVELTIGLHRVLDCPNDKLIWDVGHQTYTHKLLTGRRQQFRTLRVFQGLSGFPKREESCYDVFDTGHASNSISVALGLALAPDRDPEQAVVVVIGDGALTGGMSWEALNQAGHLKPDLVVILNDNEMSINGNVGALSCYLNRIRLDPAYNKLKQDFEEALRKIPAVGERMVHFGESFRNALKQYLVPGMLFEELGFKYIGPIDGHNIQAVESSVSGAIKIGGPIIVHILTKKGKGYLPAENSPDRFHGTGAFDIKTGSKLVNVNKTPTYTSIFGKTMIELAKQNPKILAITAAMTDGTGLRQFSQLFPDRFFDVGIAEQHAVTFAAGLALAGWQPVVAIYSTFLQRAYDQLIEDVCLQKLPVVFALDRGGLVGDDGPTHHGAFDLSYLSQMPHMTVMAPKDENELRAMLYTAVKEQFDGPVTIRYPRGCGVGVKLDKQPKLLKIGKAELLQEGKDVAILAVGRMVKVASQASDILRRKSSITSTVVNARFVKPIDHQLIKEIAKNHSLIVTLEENTTIGGFGAAVAQVISKIGGSRLLNFGLPDKFVAHGNIDQLFECLGLSASSIAEQIFNNWES